ncbi:MAG: hypothetical protein EZS28_030132 [Streblomastix strix]|uniref:Uncharacterized protein n=1 Tax=Streblomastix strix TaxID=222440 RepID=A0A5J4UWQ6_9EUKA|nr:MAG: hypothetical protein EZS28_030132 [Streblomastix strix]
MEKIRGVAFQQILKKPQAETSKPIKEDQTLQLTEMEFLVLVIATIMEYSTIRLTEVHKSMVSKLPKRCWQVKAAMFERHDTCITVIFRTLEDLRISPAQWLSSWMSGRKKKNKNLHIRRLYSKNRAALHEETSKAIHFVMRACKIPTVFTVIFIKFSSMTKSIDQGATKIEISRAINRKVLQAVANPNDKNFIDKIRKQLAKL